MGNARSVGLTQPAGIARFCELALTEASSGLAHQPLRNVQDAVVRLARRMERLDNYAAITVRKFNTQTVARAAAAA